MTLHDELEALLTEWGAESEPNQYAYWKRVRAILARHPEPSVSICNPCMCTGAMAEGMHVRPQLQVQAPVGDSPQVRENGASDGEREALRERVMRDLGTASVCWDEYGVFMSEYVAALGDALVEYIAAGYRKAPVVNVEDVKAWALKEFGVSNGTQVWIEFQGDPDKFATAIKAHLLDGGV